MSKTLRIVQRYKVKKRPCYRRYRYRGKRQKEPRIGPRDPYFKRNRFLRHAMHGIGGLPSREKIPRKEARIVYYCMLPVFLRHLNDPADRLKILEIESFYRTLLEVDVVRRGRKRLFKPLRVYSQFCPLDTKGRRQSSMRASTDTRSGVIVRDAQFTSLGESPT